MGRVVLMTVVAVIAVVGCGPSDSPATDATVPDASVTTTSVTTTPVTTTPVTTTPVTTTTAAEVSADFEVGEPTLLPWEPLAGSGGASGSGCAPGAGPLPDGVWFGYAIAIAGDAVDFDLACWYFGDIAWEKAAEVGEEAPNDFWIVNANPTLRTVAVAEDVTVFEIDPDCCDFLEVPFAEWPAHPEGYIQCPGDGCGIWLLVNDAVVTEIVEQYAP